METPGYLAYHPNPKKPDIKLPETACDSHCHVFGPGERFPYSASSSYVPVDAPVEALVKRHDFLGLDRAVIVQASCHGTDNRAMLDALERYPDRYRGIGIVDAGISVEELSAMHEKGVRGVRFNFVKRLKAKQSSTERRKIVDMIAEFGWHIVVYLEPTDLDEVEEFLKPLSTTVVFDHMGRVPVEEGVTGVHFNRLLRLIQQKPNYWVKLSCPERISIEGPPYSDVDEIAKKFMEEVGDRTLWGTDWPHPNMKSHMPDDGQLVDRLERFCPDPDDLHRLLVTNPNRLYWSD